MGQTEAYIQMAIDEAIKAKQVDEVPIGAIIVSPNNDILAKAYNIKESSSDPCGHAEILAIKKAAATLQNWRLTGCKIYVTLEPCPMCLNAMIQSRIDSLVFGAYDFKGGSISLGYKFYNDQRLNHSFSVMGGVLEHSCSTLLSNFFRTKREQKKS